MKAQKSFIVMGPPGTGKTTFVNAAANANFQVNTDLESGPMEVKSAKTHLGGVEIRVVDTPALDSEDAAEVIIRYLRRKQQDMSIVGVIFMYEMTNIARLDQTISQSCQRFIDLCGLHNMSNAVVVTWSGPSVQNAGRRTSELREAEPFSKMVNNGARMIPFTGSRESAINILQAFIDKNPVALACQQEQVLIVDAQGGAGPLSPETSCCCSWWPWRRK